MRSQIFLVVALLSAPFASASSGSATISIPAAPINQLNDKLAGMLRLLDSCEQTLRVIQAGPAEPQHGAIRNKLNELNAEITTTVNDFENTVASVSAAVAAAASRVEASYPVFSNTATVSSATANTVNPVSSVNPITNTTAAFGNSPSGSSVSTEDDDADFDEINIPTSTTLAGTKRVVETTVAVPESVVSQASKRARNDSTTAASIIDITDSVSMPKYVIPSTTTATSASVAAPAPASSGNMLNIQNLTSDTIAQRLAKFKSGDLSGIPVRAANPVTVSYTSSSNTVSSSSSNTVSSSSSNMAGSITAAPAPQAPLDSVVDLMFNSSFLPFARALMPFVQSNQCTSVTSNGQCLFEIAVRRGASLAVLQYLLGAKCYRVQFTGNETALEVAIKNKNVELLKAMLKIEVFAEELQRDMARLFGIAAFAGDEEILDLLSQQISA